MYELTPETLALAEQLRECLYEANANESQANQNSTFGLISLGIQSTIAAETSPSVGLRVYEIMLEGGENVEYSLNYLNYLEANR